MKTNQFHRLLVACAVTALTGLSAHAEVIDFNGLAGTNMPGSQSSFPELYTYFSGPSTVGSYSFDDQNYGHWYTGYWNTVTFCGGLASNCAYNGTDGLITGSHLSIKRTDGQAFNLNGLDLDNSHDDGITSPAQTSFVIKATLAGGGTISQTVTLDNLPNYATYGTSAAYNHFDFSTFNNITGIEIDQQGGNGWSGIALDNLNVSNNPAPVPEPATWGMFVLGLAGLLVYGKRRAA